MFQFAFKLKVAERVKAKCERHPGYSPERKHLTFTGGSNVGPSSSGVSSVDWMGAYRRDGHDGRFCQRRDLCPSRFCLCP
jgi:hypothetical protein